MFSIYFVHFVAFRRFPLTNHHLTNRIEQQHLVSRNTLHTFVGEKNLYQINMSLFIVWIIFCCCPPKKKKNYPILLMNVSNAGFCVIAGAVCTFCDFSFVPVATTIRTKKKKSKWRIPLMAETLIVRKFAFGFTFPPKTNSIPLWHIGCTAILRNDRHFFWFLFVFILQLWNRKKSFFFPSTIWEWKHRSTQE